MWRFFVVVFVALIAASVVPPGGRMGENGRKSWASPHRVVADVIVVAPPGVAAERGEDPAVDGSHGKEEEGGIEDDNDNE
jgi:hypothetical protein